MILGQRSFLLKLLLASALVIYWPDLSGAAQGLAPADETGQAVHPPKIATIGYVTWWSHDAIGYHPAVYLKLENNSQLDLSGIIVHFQARFADLRNGYVTVARIEKRRDFLPHQQVSFMLRGPKAWELPIDLSAWPTIECKVMCRVGDAGDEGTQDLCVTRLEQITMTDEEALAELTEQTGVGRSSRSALRDGEPGRAQKHDRVEHVIAVPAKALMATAGNLLGTRAKPADSEADKHEKKIASLNIPSSLPALGDDFYLFEKYFGLPTDQGVVASKNDLTWVRYPAKGFFNDVWVSSRATSGKADLIVVTIANQYSPKEAQLLAIAKLLTGKANRGQNFAPFVHSVRYLPSGRSEVLRTAGLDLHVVAFALPKTAGQDALTVLAVSRLPGDLEGILATYAKRIQMLANLLPGLQPEAN